MYNEPATMNPQPRMAAFKTDLFDEINDLSAELEAAKIQRILLTATAIVLGVLCLYLGIVLYFSGLITQ